jgi:hypothetical protein
MNNEVICALSILNAGAMSAGYEYLDLSATTGVLFITVVGTSRVRAVVGIFVGGLAAELMRTGAGATEGHAIRVAAVHWTGAVGDDSRDGRSALGRAGGPASAIDAVQTLIGAAIATVRAGLTARVLHTSLAFAGAVVAAATAAVAMPAALDRRIDAQNVVVIGWEVLRAAVSHLTAVPKVITVANDGDVSSHWVGGARGASSHHHNSASGSLVGVIGVLGLNVLQAELSSVVALIQVFGELISVLPVLRRNGVIKPSLVDSSIASSIDVVSNV